jgi:hypothetical protein
MMLTNQIILFKPLWYNLYMDERDLLKQQAIRQNQAETLEVAEADILNEQSIATICESRRKSGLALTYKDQPVILDQNKPIGTGGSKEVYSVKIGEQHYALAIHAVDIDRPITIMRKWKVILKEPENTAIIRQLGLNTNSLCQLVPVKVNGTEFPALVMMRYQDLPYEVRDSKNQKSSIGETRVLPEQYSEESLEKAFDNIVLEIEILLKNNISLNKDSFNLAIVEGKAHLYFNDLGNASFESIPREDLENYIDSYVDYAMIAFINGITDIEYQRITDKYNYQNLKNKLKRKLQEKFI